MKKTGLEQHHSELQLSIEELEKKLEAQLPVVVNGREQTLEFKLDTAAF